MNTPLMQIQIFYEIATAIGNCLDLQKMLHESLSAYLHKLSCFTGMALRATSNDSGEISLAPVAKIPSKARPSVALKEALTHIPDRFDAETFQAFCHDLPSIRQVDNDKRAYLMLLPEFGLLLLIKSGQPFNHEFLKSLNRLNVKLAGACLACLQNENIARINEQLRHEIGERLRAEDALRELLEELESRVSMRTRDLMESNRKLEDALARVNLLSGLLPICSACKKIRDDRGYWNQIETYISKHSEAMFTHGICPECEKKLYPNVSYD